MSAPDLTPKQEDFCLSYIETGNASEAYRRAYEASNMAASTVHREAHALLDNPKITTRLAELRVGHQKRHEVTVDRVLQEYSRLAFANMLDYVTIDKDGGAFVDLSCLTRDQAAAIQEIVVDRMPARAGAGEGDGETKIPVLKTRFKLSDKKAALDSLAKHLGLFKDKVEHAGKDGGPIQTETGPRAAGADYLEALSKRYAGGLRVVEGTAKAKPNGKGH